MDETATRRKKIDPKLYELGSDKLPTLINMKYHTPVDAVRQLKMQPAQIRDFYLDMQHQLYDSPSVVNLTIHNHFDGIIDNLTIKGE